MINFLDSYDELTASEKKALKYMIDHTEEIPYLYINDLAEAAFVSKTVIINLSQKLGFSGYKELKYHINNVVRAAKNEVSQQRLPITENLRRSIDKTFSLVSEEELKRCVDVILNAKNLFVMARGTSKAAGYYLEHLLFSLGIHCIFIKDYNLSESFTNLVTDQDVVILISLSGNTKKIVETAKKIELKKAKIISMTSFQSNTLTSYTDYHLYCHTDNWDTKRDDTISRIGFFILIDLLINYLGEAV
ncbi:MurR/RpiR family transcriptional regulator [Numidum massiliense]|uniref:MurR/RpiR family transcriptional regulator n=1 Tax=Numidum massiliense TaxID=1522315 RepID=UPI0006D5515C|nr:MurR/RpiR family transcriptional regulator [Numidum massiliense]